MIVCIISFCSSKRSTRIKEQWRKSYM